ncbi:MAG: DNA-processing protein DprA [Chloroflexota bacterium]
MSMVEPKHSGWAVWGNAELLGRLAVGICGARDADEQAIELSERFGRLMAEVGLVVISGNARGVDDAAQFGGLDAGGSVISVLAEGLADWNPRLRYRPLINDLNYAAVSEFEADAGWQAWRAMQRNGTILDLARALVVVQSGTSGGTWNAGLEALRRGTPLLVVQRQSKPETEGNAHLIARGGIPVNTVKALKTLLEAIRDGDTLPNGQQTLL